MVPAPLPAPLGMVVPVDMVVQVIGAMYWRDIENDDDEDDTEVAFPRKVQSEQVRASSDADKAGYEQFGCYALLLNCMYIALQYQRSGFTEPFYLPAHKGRSANHWQPCKGTALHLFGCDQGIMHRELLIRAFTQALCIADGLIQEIPFSAYWQTNKG